MARTTRTAAAVPESTQKVQEQQDMSRDTQGRETASEAAQEAQDELEMGMDAPDAQEAAEAAQTGTVTQEIVGPDDPADLLGCEEGDADKAELAEGLFTEYAVTAKGGLRLRKEPSPDAPILAVLPRGAGVLACEEPENGWLYVHTGRLEGWMMSKHLEALSWPELAAYGAG